MGSDLFTSRSERGVGYTAAGWCLLFAAVSGWQLVVGVPPDNQYAAYASGIAAMSLIVMLLKLLGALVAFVAVTPLQRRTSAAVLGTALWGAFALLGIYSAGNLIITVGTLTGLLTPTAAWTDAGGVTLRAGLYVAFFLAGSAVFGVLAVAFHRRRRPGWRPVLVGAVGAPVILGLLLAVAPAILGWLGLLPA